MVWGAYASTRVLFGVSPNRFSGETLRQLPGSYRTGTRALPRISFVTRERGGLREMLWDEWKRQARSTNFKSDRRDTVAPEDFGRFF
jgi:hypothetical protein